MASVLKWYEVELEREIRAETAKRLRQAAILVRDSARKKVRKSKEPHTFRGEVYQPGSLRKSISYRVNSRELKARIGTSLVYGIFQELGPVTSKKRWGFTPYLRPAFHENESQIKDILGVNAGVSASNIKDLKPSDILLE